MNRREFLKTISFFGATVAINPQILTSTVVAQSKNPEVIYKQAKTKFDELIKLAKSKKWNLMPMGDLVARIGFEFLGTPYGAGTLDVNPTQENVIINFSELDCVTFFENSLCIARCIKMQKFEFEDLFEQIKFTRYRGGVLTDYSSRLHYTSEWILDNVKKGTVQDITQEIGGIEHKFDLSFMTNNPKNYAALNQKNSENLIQKIREIEAQISKEKFYIIPNNQISRLARNINDGDIIAIAIKTKGLDYGHLGISFDRKLMHASRRLKKVIVDNSISQYVNSNQNNIGITVLRPLEFN